MAIHRGIQSAVFYYLSCAPCTEARVRKKRKKEAKHGHAEREALYQAMPHLYRHPAPSGTNPHWEDEIAAGPALVHRGRKKNGNSGKDNDSARGRAPKSSMTQRSNGSAAPSSVSVNFELGTDGRNDSKMQVQRDRRNDEGRWTSNTSLQRLQSRGSSGITRPPSAHVSDSSSYSRARTPAVNDLHPAVVTKMASRDDAHWMMEPPPTADVTSGRERVFRSRSDSGGSSRLSARSGVPLSREVSERIVAQKLRYGEVLPSPTLSRASTALSENAPKGQRHDRTATDEIDFALVSDSPRKVKRIPSPIRIQVSEDSSDSGATVLRDQSQAVARPQARRAASRPQLSTIVSDSIIAQSIETDGVDEPASGLRPANHALFRQSYSDNTDIDRDRISRRSPLLPFHDTSKRPPLITKHVVSSEDIRRDPGVRNHQNLSPPRVVRLASTDSSSEEATLAGSPDLFDSWTSADFALPEWILEHTKREVPRHRWSMDI